MIKEFQGKYRWLSNFWPVQIKYNNRLYSSVEHAYMSSKSHSSEWKDFCVLELDPRIVKKASNEVALRTDWEEVKENIMFELTQLKYQNTLLRKKLLKTADIHIQEGNNWNDIFWGVDIATKEGENKLGKIIMNVRNEIKESHILGKYLKEGKKIILFDGECNLCDWSVQLLLRNDPHDTFRFASLQSDLGIKIQSDYGIDATQLNSVILIDDYTDYKSKSSAIFSMTRSMGKLWPVFTFFWIIPKPIRDWVYTIITKNRYQCFGRKNTCMVMTDDIRHKFLEEHVA